MKKLKLLAGLAFVSAITGCQSLYTGEVPLDEFDFVKSYELNEFEVQSSRISKGMIHNYTEFKENLRFPCTPLNCKTNDFLVLSHDEIDSVESNALKIKERSEWKIDYNVNVSMNNNMLDVTFDNIVVYYVFIDTNGEDVILPRKTVSGRDYVDIESFFKVEANRIKSAY